MPDDGPANTGKSLHDTIRDDLEHRILSGDWAPGHKVPSELELSEEYGCSRMTVNKVMTQLAGAGLILRRRKVGSVVLPQKSQNAVLEIHDVKEEVLARGGWYRHKIMGRRRLDSAAGPLADGLPGDRPVIAVTCLHFSDDAPFCHEDRIIYLDAVPEAETASFDATPPGAWLLTHVPWSEAENVIAAIDADDALAEALGIGPGDACLTMSRRTWKNGDPVTSVRFSYPGTAHRLTARFTPAQG